MIGTPPADHDWKSNPPIKLTTNTANATPFLNAIANALKGKPEPPVANRQQYLSLIDDDGSFVIDDVPPGTYTLSVSLTAISVEANPFQQKSIGAIEKQIEVIKDQNMVNLGIIEGNWTPRAERAR